MRTLLVERAAQMLRARDPITLRSLVAGTGASTMAVYTHFGGINGLWRALRQEGFTRLDERFAAVVVTPDPVHDLAALVAAYFQHALDHPDLYRVMFDASVDLENLAEADATLEYLVRTVKRMQNAGRVRPDIVPLDLATQAWAASHGLVSLVTTGPLPDDALRHGPAVLTALLLMAGDEPAPCRDSIADGWPAMPFAGRGR